MKKIKYITAFCMMICIIMQLHTNASANENNICYVAHRGYTKYAPENSIPACEAVSREGFQAVECDIHETAKDKKGKRRFVIMYDQAVVTCKYKQQLTYMRKYAHKMPLEYVRHDFTQNDLSWMKKYHINVSIDKNILSDDMIQLFETNNIKINIWTINNKDQLYNFTNKGIKIVTSDDVLW